MNQLKFRDSLYDTMKIFNEALLKEAGVTQVISGKVISVENDGFYTIEYLGNKFKAHTIGEEIYQIEDEVYILIPYGDYSKNKIILGTTEAGSRHSVTSSITKSETHPGTYELNLFNTSLNF